MGTRKVFVTNSSHHDISAAKEYGELVIMSNGPINRYAIGQMFRVFLRYMKDSDPEDYILCTGLTQMGMVAVAIMVRLHGRANLLIHKYKNRKDAYVERIISFDDVPT